MALPLRRPAAAPEPPEQPRASSRRVALRAHPLAPFVSLVALAALVTAGLHAALGLPGLVDTVLTGVILGTVSGVIGGGLLLARSARAALHAHSAGGDVVSAAAQAMIRTLRDDAPRAALVVVSASVLAATVTGWRLAIPTLNPYAWDAPLAALDRALHGGVDPWRWTAPLLGPVPTRALLILTYVHLWFSANIVTMAGVGWWPVGRRGQQFLVTFTVASLVLGAGVAHAVSSAGPVYYGRVLGIAASVDPFAPLLALLDNVAVGDLGPRVMQEYLWSQYTAGELTVTTGITAFPSMHVATAALLALALGTWRRWAGVLGWVGVLLTHVSAVALGWHYAVDGYASVAVVLALWWAVGRWQRGRAH